MKYLSGAVNLCGSSPCYTDPQHSSDVSRSTWPTDRQNEHERLIYLQYFLCKIAHRHTTLLTGSQRGSLHGIPACDRRAAAATGGRIPHPTKMYTIHVYIDSDFQLLFRMTWPPIITTLHQKSWHPENQELAHGWFCYYLLLITPCI